MATIAYTRVPQTLHPQGDGTYTADLPQPYSAYKTVNPDGSSRPGIAGDVMSCQPDGSVQGRPQGTAGPWERFTLQGAGWLFNVADGISHLFYPLQQ